MLPVQGTKKHSNRLFRFVNATGSSKQKKRSGRIQLKNSDFKRIYRKMFLFTIIFVFINIKVKINVETTVVKQSCL